jgi:hypothetical protein
VILLSVVLLLDALPPARAEGTADEKIPPTLPPADTFHVLQKQKSRRTIGAGFTSDSP